MIVGMPEKRFSVSIGRVEKRASYIEQGWYTGRKKVGAKDEHGTDGNGECRATGTGEAYLPKAEKAVGF